MASSEYLNYVKTMPENKSGNGRLYNAAQAFSEIWPHRPDVWPDLPEGKSKMFKVTLETEGVNEIAVVSHAQNDLDAFPQHSAEDVEKFPKMLYFMFNQLLFSKSETTAKDYTQAARRLFEKHGVAPEAMASSGYLNYVKTTPENKIVNGRLYNAAQAFAEMWPCRPDVWPDLPEGKSKTFKVVMEAARATEIAVASSASNEALEIDLEGPGGIVTFRRYTLMDLEEFPKITYALHVFLLLKKSESTARQYVNAARRCFEMHGVAPQTMVSQKYLEFVKSSSENKKSTNQLYSGVKFLSELWTERPQVWPEIPEASKGNKMFRVVMDLKGVQRKDPKEPAYKKQKVEQDVESSELQPCSFGDETDTEIGSIDAGNLSANTYYDLRPCRDGSAWIALPRDVLFVSLDWISSRFTRAGWSLESKTESRAVFVANGSIPHVAFYFNKGKLLMKTDDKAKASGVAELYDDWLAEGGEDR